MSEKKHIDVARQVFKKELQQILSEGDEGTIKNIKYLKIGGRGDRTFSLEGIARLEDGRKKEVEAEVELNTSVGFSGKDKFRSFEISDVSDEEE